MEKEYKRVSELSKDYGLSVVLLYSLFKNSKVTPINQNFKGKPSSFYDKSEVDLLVAKYIDLPRVSEETQTYQDSEGRDWLPLTSAAKRLGLWGATLLKLCSKPEIIEGRDRQGRPTKLLNLQQLETAAKDYFSLPQVDKDSLKYVDQNGQSWVTVAELIRKYKIEHTRIKAILKSTKILQGKDQIGVKTSLYNEQEAALLLEGVGLLPKVSRKTGIYLDQSGSEWASTSYFEDILGISEYLIKKYCNSIKSIQGRNRGGRPCLLYPIQGIKEMIGKLPTSGGDKGVIKQDNKEWALASVLANEFGIAPNSINNHLKDKVSFVTARLGTNHLAAYYDREQARDKLKSFLDKPSLDKETGELIDDSGVKYVPFKYFRDKYGLSSKTWIRLRGLEGRVRAIEGRARNGNQVILLAEEDVLKEVKWKKNSKLEEKLSLTNTSLQLKELTGV